MTTKELIKETLSSGVEPITAEIKNVYSTTGNPDPIAYRSRLVLNSTVLGFLTPAEYQITADKSERGILLSDRALAFVCKAIEEKLEKEERFLWISLYCPIKMLTGTDLLETLPKLFGGDKKKLEKICLELPASSLYEDPDTLRTALLDLKLIGVKSALVDYGGEFCPMMRVASFPFDYVILDPAVRDLIVSEGGTKAAETLISYARSLRIEVIATGVTGEEEQNAFYKADCLGFTDDGPYERMFIKEDFAPDPSVLDEEKSEPAKAEEPKNDPAEQAAPSGADEAAD